MINNYELKIERFEITDLTGKIILSNFQIEGFSNFQIDISNYTNGVYNIVIYTNEKIIIRKIIKK